MDDEADSSGLSGWAWYQLGQMSSDVSRSHRRSADILVDALSGRHEQEPSLRQEYDEMHQEAIRANCEVRKGNANFKLWMEKHNKLKAKLADRDAEIAKLRQYVDDSQAHMQDLRAGLEAQAERLALVTKCYEDVSNSSGSRCERINELEEIIQQLRDGTPYSETRHSRLPPIG